METVTERVAYLKGLFEGMEIDTAKKEGKLLQKMIEVMEVMAGEIEYLDETVDELDDYIAQLEEEISDLQDECDGCECDEDEEYDGFVCPKCGNTVYLNLDDFDDEEEILCPSCNAPLFEDEEEE